MSPPGAPAALKPGRWRSDTSRVPDLALVLPLTEPDLAALPLDLLRAHRSELLAECARADHWRRIVQAHLDLAVHAAAPAEAMQGSGAPLRQVAAALSGACTAGGGAGAGAGTSDRDGGVGGVALVVEAGPDPVVALRDLEAARSELTGYASRLRPALRAATDELVERYRRTPRACLSVQDSPV